MSTKPTSIVPMTLPDKPVLPVHHQASAYLLNRALLARAQCYLGLLILISADRSLKLILTDLNFPSPLVGMGLIITSLVSLRRYDPRTAAATHAFFSPAVDWVAHKWLPVFYSPALVTLPLALAPIPAPALASAVAVVIVGTIMTCAFTARTAMAIRAITGTDHSLIPEQQAEKVHFTRVNYAVWAGIAAAGAARVAAELQSHSATGGSLVPPPPVAPQPVEAFLLFLAATVLGYMGGVALPDFIKRAVHPMLAAAAAANAVAAALGWLSGVGYIAQLKLYLAKGDSTIDFGPGDLLFSFLGVIILCFGFKVYERWDVLCRHYWEVIGSCSLGAAFTMLSTAALAGAVGLPGDLARGLVPRGSTLALALPIGERIGATPQITAAGIAMTGMLAVNFIPAMLSAVGAKDPISRGIAAAATAHGLGTAAMASKEPEALPFAALSYALCGVFATLWACLPIFKSAILAMTG